MKDKLIGLVILLVLCVGSTILATSEAGFSVGVFVSPASFVFVVGFGAFIHRMLLRVRDASNELEKANALIRGQNSQLANELEKAHELQMALMPTRSPEIHNYAFSGICKPATQVGGDFYQYHHVSDNRWILTLADVTGHAPLLPASSLEPPPPPPPSPSPPVRSMLLVELRRPSASSFSPRSKCVPSAPSSASAASSRPCRPAAPARTPASRCWTRRWRSCYPTATSPPPGS